MYEVIGMLGVGIPIVLGIVVIIFLFKQAYIKSPPNEMAIITGLSKKPRTLHGKAGFKIPFLETVNKLNVEAINISIKTEEYIPTKDFINVNVDAISQVSLDLSEINSEDPEKESGIQIAMRNFLDKDENKIREMVTKSLQGNLREIIGTMDLKAISQDKALFSAMVKENAQTDMARLGIVINSFNVMNVADEDGLIKDLGIDNREQIRKEAAIAKAAALRDIDIKQAEADNDASMARVQSDTAIAQRENELAIKKAELKVTEDTKRAEADAAYEIQKQVSRKTVEVETQEADIAKRIKEVELQAREAEVTEKRLEAEIIKKADADKYAEEKNADADKYKREKDAEARLYEQQKEAAAIEAMGKAEAEAIRLKGLAEAESIDAKAEAMTKYGQAAILEMVVGVLPQMAEAIAKPIAAIDKVSIIGGNSDGVSDMSGNVPVILAKVMESVRESTGIDMNDLIKANTYDAKVTRNLNITGLESNNEVTDVLKEELDDLLHNDGK